MRLSLLILLLTLSFAARGQFLTPQYHIILAPNLFYLELMGNGDYLSLNYEQVFAQSEYAGAGARFGFGLFPKGDGLIDYNVPVTISGFFGKGNVFGEIGGGVRLHADSRVMEIGGEIIPTGILGVRYHPDRSGGVFLKLAYTPFLESGALRHHAGLAIGVGFGR
jgi:hypothetical protein